MNVTQFHTRHFNKRPLGVVPDAIVIHDTGGQSARSTLDWFERPESGVSSHFLIDKDGTVYECVPVEDRAWHAGLSTLHGREDVNDFSIGIELVDNNDGDKYPDAQLSSLFTLCAELCGRFRIPLNRIVGHCHVAPDRKVDPGKDFPWYEFLSTLGGQLVEAIESDDSGEG